MSMRGHNEIPVRLGMLADDAKRALTQVEQGEAGAVEGWLAYGVALNEGRSLFPGDREFGQWVAGECSSNLEVHPAEQSAAMWAAANVDQFEEARAAGKARTVRGIHEKWKQIEFEREKAGREAEQKAEVARLRAEQEAAAAAARQEAEEHAKAEAEARDAAERAQSDHAKAAAEAQAEEAAAAKTEALKDAQAAEAAIAELAEPERETELAVQVDPNEAPIRAEWRRLADAAREDGFVQARLLLIDREAELRETNKRVEELERWWNASIQGENMGRALGQARVQIDTMTGRLREYQATNRRLDFRLKKAEARVKELESMEVSFG